MSISIQCDGCKRRYEAPDSAAGKAVRCKNCGQVIHIPAEKPRRDEDQPPEMDTLSSLNQYRSSLQLPPESKPSFLDCRIYEIKTFFRHIPGMVWKSLLVLLLIGLLVGIAISVFNSLRQDRRKIAAKPVSPPTVQRENPQPSKIANPPTAPPARIVTTPPPGPNPTKPVTPRVEKPAPVAPRVVVAPPAGRVVKPKEPEPWKLSPDASSFTIGLNYHIRIPVKQLRKVFYPRNFTGMLVLLEQNSCRSLNLLNQRTIGTFRGTMHADELWVSPDGQVVIGCAANSLNLEAWSFGSTKLVAKLQAEKSVTSQTVLGFCGPTPIVLASKKSSDQVFLWDFKSTKPKATREMSADCLYALSAQGRYLLAIDGQQLQIFTLPAMTLSAQMELPKIEGRICSVAFSPDGKELAILWDKGSAGAQLCAWDMEGKSTANLAIPPGSQALPATVRMLWFPDRSGWLVGCTVIDRAVGRGVYTLQRSEKYPDAGIPLVVLDRDHVFMEYRVTTPVACLVHQSIALPREQIDAAIDAARAQDNSGTELMRLEPRSPEPVAKLAPVDSAMLWRADADPAPASPSSLKPATLQFRNMEGGIVPTLSSSSSKITGMLDQPRAVFFSRRDTAQAVVEHTVGQTAADGAPYRLWLERCDLANGTSLPPLPLPAVLKMLDLSDDGKTALMATAGRVDLWSLAPGDEKSLSAWMTDVAESLSQPVIWGSIVDASHVLTMNSAGLIVLWDIPSHKPLWSIQGSPQANPLLSPGHQYLAVPMEKTITILQLPTGQPAGILTAKEFQPKTLVFNSDGKRLAAVGLCGASPMLAVWNFRLGKTIDEFPLRMTDCPNCLTWLGEDFLRLGNVAVDLKRKSVLAHYISPLATRWHNAPPDGRWWFLTERDHNDNSILLSLPLPPNVFVQGQAIPPLEDQLVLRPGAAITVDLAAISDGQLAANILQQLKDNGYQVSSNQSTKLVARHQKNGLINVFYIDPSTGLRRTGDIHKCESHLSIVINGQTCWEWKAKADETTPGYINLTNPDGVTTRVPHATNNPDQFLLDEIRLPRYIFTAQSPGLVPYFRLTPNGSRKTLPPSNLRP